MPQLIVSVERAIVLAGGLSTSGTDRRIKISRVVHGMTVEIAAQLGDKMLPDDVIKISRAMF